MRFAFTPMHRHCIAIVAQTSVMPCNMLRGVASVHGYKPRLLASNGPGRQHSQRLKIRAPANRRDDQQTPMSGRSAEERQSMEDELRDPSNFVEYFLPRPLRIVFFYGSGASCLIATILSVLRLVQGPGAADAAGNALQDVLVNLIGTVTFLGLGLWDQQAAEKRVEQRRRIRQAQIRTGERITFMNDAGEKVSKLKEVDDDWILMRLERWGKKDGMPFVGPKKGAILQQLVKDKQPKLAVEVGTMAGYSAIMMAQVLPEQSKLVSFEKDLSWVLIAKRFLWQASQGEKNKSLKYKVQDKVDVQWGDACKKLADIQGPIDFLFLDGVPKETLSYLKAAEPRLAPGAMVVADNAGVFAQGGMAEYLAYVRRGADDKGEGRYSSQFVECTLEWQDNVPDGLEISIFQGL